MRDNEQIDIFDILEATSNEPIYEVGNRVRIKKASELQNPDVETVAYLTDYGYGGKKGTIREIHKGKAISYKVELSKGVAWVSEGELAFIS
jgi:hypothetical protein